MRVFRVMCPDRMDSKQKIKRYNDVIDILPGWAISIMTHGFTLDSE